MRETQAYGNRWFVAALVVAAGVLEAAAQAAAGVPGKLTVNNRDFIGMVRWKASAKEYSVMDPRTNIESIHPLDNVQKIQIARPRDLDTAIAAVKAERAARNALDLTGNTDLESGMRCLHRCSRSHSRIPPGSATRWLPSA